MKQVTAQEEFFGKCTFCGNKNMIVFDVEWKSQRGSDGTYVRRGKVLLCSKCSSKYSLECSNHDYDLAVKEMCEVLDEIKE